MDSYNYYWLLGILSFILLGNILTAEALLITKGGGYVLPDNPEFNKTVGYPYVANSSGDQITEYKNPDGFLDRITFYMKVSFSTQYLGWFAPIINGVMFIILGLIVYVIIHPLK